MEQQICKENIEECKHFNELAEYHEHHLNTSFVENIPLLNTLISLAKVPEGKNILDVGCANGLSILNMLPIIKTPNILVGLDISEKMLEKAMSTFKNNKNFTCNNSNTLELLSNKEKINLSSLDIKQDTTNVKFIQGDSENLPFIDEQFDSYISSLTLHHVNDFTKSIKEIYRVLKKGGHFAIGEFGDRKLNYFDIIFSVVEKYGLAQHAKKIFRIGDDPENFVKLCEDAGFKNVKYAYTNIIRGHVNKEYIITNFDLKIKKELDEIKEKDAEKYNTIWKELNDKLDEYFSDRKNVPIFNCLCIFGEK